MIAHGAVSMLKRILSLAPAALLVSGGLLLGACSSEEGGAGAARAAAKDAAAATKKAGDSEPETLSADMVAAVTSSKEATPVQLKFVLKEHPMVGKPADIELAFLTSPGVERMLATFQASEGLDLQAGARTAAFENPVADTPISHTVTIVPSRDGIFYVTAVVLTDSSTSSMARTFSIPVIAGAGLSDDVEAKVGSPAKATKPVARVPAANPRQTQ
jgi:hypothetical protein